MRKQFKEKQGCKTKDRKGQNSAITDVTISSKLDLWDFTYGELFAGIGGVRIGLDSLGGKCVFASEWDKHCQDTYERNFGERPEGDITKIDPKDIPSCTLLAACPPCQPFCSEFVGRAVREGRPHGYDDPRGQLTLRTIDIIGEVRPEMVLIENTKNFIYHDGGKTLATAIDRFRHHGYFVDYKVMTSAPWVPQHRERMFIVAFDLKVFQEESMKSIWAFPAYPEMMAPRKLRDIMESNPSEELRLKDDQWKHRKNNPKLRAKSGHPRYKVFTPDTTAISTLMRTNSGRFEILLKDDSALPPRHFNAREFARLSGFPDSFEPAGTITHAHEQFGNAVCPPLVAHIASAMLDARAKFERVSPPEMAAADITTSYREDPEALKTWLAAEIEALHTECLALEIKKVEMAYRAGEKLLQAKAMVGYGNFEDWKTNNLIKSGSSAGDYMIVYRQIKKKYGHISGALEICPDLSIAAVLLEYHEERENDKAQRQEQNERNFAESRNVAAVIRGDDNDPYGHRFSVSDDDNAALPPKTTDAVEYHTDDPDAAITETEPVSISASSDADLAEWTRIAKQLEELTLRLQAPQNLITAHCKRMMSLASTDIAAPTASPSQPAVEEPAEILDDASDENVQPLPSEDIRLDSDMAGASAINIKVNTNEAYFNSIIDAMKKKNPSFVPEWEIDYSQLRAQVSGATSAYM